MASSQGPVYFPGLGDCLKGDKILLSWKLVNSALNDPSTDRLLTEPISDFLRDPSVLGFVNKPFELFEKPSPKTKSDFDARTAAINVTPAQDGRYDIKVIKEDALWLSKTVDINEVAALRVVVLEFQTRPQSHLSSPLSTQDIINLQQAVGADGSQANSLLASVNAGDTLDVDKIWSGFNTDESRRRRILEIYLSERRFCLAFVDSALHMMLESSYNADLTGPKTTLCLQLLETVFGGRDPTELRNPKREKLLSTYIALLPKYLARADDGPADVLASMGLEFDWLRTAITETLHLLASIFQITDLVDVFLPANIVSAWFGFVQTYNFLDGLPGVDEQTNELLLPLKSLVCIISMKMLNLPRSVPFLDGEISDLFPDEDSYITSEDVLKQVDDTINHAADASLITAGPVIFTWTLIVQQMLRSHHDRQERRDLQQNRQAQEGFEREVENIESRPGVGRRSSAGSIVSMESQSYDKFLNTVYGSTSQQQQDLQRIEQMAIVVTAGGQMHNFLSAVAQTLGEGHTAAFRPFIGARMRSVIYDFLMFSFPVVGYITESISTFFAVVSAGRGYWDITTHGTHAPSAKQDIIVQAMSDPMAMQQYIGQIWLRWPYEFGPFTSLCKEILTSPLTEFLPTLAETPSLTFHLPDPFWEFAEDEADMGRLELREDVPLFSVLQARKRITLGAEPFCIPAGTMGQLASDTARVVQVQYTHSTLALLGKRLEANLAADSYNLALGQLESEDLAETLSLLAIAIRSESVKAAADDVLFSGNAATLAVLEELGQSLPVNKDIITVVTDTLDSFVDGDLADLEAPGIRVITACLQFLDSILPVCPGRVWSYLTRCDLLMSASKAGRLSRITGTLDLTEEQFELLVTVVNFFSDLVESAVASAVHRKIDIKASGRASENDLIWQGTSDRALTQVTLSIAHTAVDILENSLTWRFSSEIHRSILLADLIPTLTILLTNSLGMADGNNQNTVLACLGPAAQYILDGFLSPASSSLRFQPLLASMLVALGLPDSTVYQKRADIICSRQIAVLNFATILIRIANSQHKPVTAIEGQLLKCSSLLARLCAADAKYTEPILSLLGALAERISRDDSETPSLLGYLGPQVSRSFLQTISRLDKPFNRPKESKNTWAFFSTIMRNGQHWMANCLLTGKTPREARGSDGKLSKLSPDSILKTALARLRSIRSLPTPETLAILDLLTSAHNYWQWTVFASQEDNGCLNELRAYVRELKPIAVTAKTDVKQAGDEARIAAYIAEAFAMHLYHLRKTGREREFAKELAQDIDYYLRDGVTVSGYNISLHVNFSKNFTKQYPDFKLENFQRTLNLPREPGRGYYYALDLADKMLRFDPNWAGPREKQGFRNEMATANLNLSLVDAQVALFHAWEFLLLELSSCMAANELLITQQMQQVAKQCLEHNQTNQGPERIFMRITQSRANLALVILQRLPPASLTPRDTAELLTAVWATVSSIENPLVADQIEHWRIMLRMLYVALRGYRTSSRRPTAGTNNAADDDRLVEVTQCVFNILHQVVAQGFRSWVTLIHDADAAVLPEDLALITAILQACLCLPGIDGYPSEILNIMVSEDVGQVALALFSWADRLAVKGDPLYGELSILFLLQLSTVPAIAEQLASDGLLAQITSASITTHIQGRDVSPFSDNIGAQRCYEIWAKGILPLLLNVLSAPGLGPNIATEVAYVLNQFPNLLKSSADRIEPPGISRTTVRGAHYVTLVGVSEVNSLALLTRGLSMYRNNYNREIPDVSWDSATALEGVDYWLSTRNMLRERMLPLGQREADWRAMKTGVEGVSVLEEKIVSLLEAVKEVLSEDQD